MLSKQRTNQATVMVENQKNSMLECWMDRNGCSLEAIQDVLNHVEPDMTLVYIEPSKKRIDAAFKEYLKHVKMPKHLQD
jgi:hypothetical protein